MRIRTITGFALVAALTAGTAAAAPGQAYSDEWLEGRISGAIGYNTAIDSSALSVDANGGAVTLTGKVPSEVEREFVERLAKSVEGVSSVKNELEIDESMKFQPRSSMQQKFTDASITASVKSKLLANRNTHGLSINVDTEGNAVTLGGTVKSANEKALAEKLAYETSGVREVRNNLLVGNAPPAASPNADSKDLGDAVTDAWINTKARAILGFSNDYPGSDVDVTTQEGRVTLQGFARSPEQKQAIEQTIAELAGVKAVNNQLVVRKTNQGA